MSQEIFRKSFCAPAFEKNCFNLQSTVCSSRIRVDGSLLVYAIENQKLNVLLSTGMSIKT